MKASTSIIRTKIEEILVHWNKNCKDNGLEEQFAIKYEIVDEAIEVKDKKGFIRLGRLTLVMLKEIKVGEEIIDIGVMVIYKKDIPLPLKVKDIKGYNWEEEVSKELLYEMLGNFCMILRGMMYEKIRIDTINKLNSDIQGKIHKEESAILDKPEEEKTEEDRIFSLMQNSKTVKVKKTGILDVRGNDILSQEE